MLEGPSDIADVEHKFIKIHAVALKVKYKTFVNIGNDCIFMSQKLPDFFLIQDPQKRSEVIEEYKKDNNLSDDQFSRRIEDQVQGPG